MNDDERAEKQSPYTPWALWCNEKNITHVCHIFKTPMEKNNSNVKEKQFSLLFSPTFHVAV